MGLAWLKLRSVLAMSVIYLSCVRLIEAVGNLDTLEPIVRYSPASRGSVSSSDDLFGFSVALHQIAEPTPGDFMGALSVTKIIAGAPLGTYPGGLMSRQRNANTLDSTGLVYQCPITRGTCDGIFGDDNGADRRLFDPDGNSNLTISTVQNTIIERKMNQHMGATVTSSGDFFVACAPLFKLDDFPGTGTINVDNRRPVGRCLVSPRSLEGFEQFPPCGITSNVLTGASDICLQGFSAVITERSDEEVALLGAPAYAQDTIGSVYSFRLNNISDLSGGDLNTENIDIIDGLTVYQAYALAVGNITGGADLDYIMTVPRANGSDYLGQLLIRRASDFQRVQRSQRIKGKQLAEYFGYSVAAADLNNDGYDEVLVGAPYYSDFDNNIPEIGRVFVFENIQGELDETTDIILLGDSSPNARFGSTIVNLGDVNDDGYEDVAIGAPFQTTGNDNAVGVVHVYYGSGDNVIERSAGQTISSENVLSSVTGLDHLRGFGWSLSSDVDVDNNDYNDLLVGAHESGTAVLFRALSVATISINITEPNVTLSYTDVNDSFTLRICASYRGRGLGGTLDTTLIISEVGNTVRKLVFQGGNDQHMEQFRFIDVDEPTCKNVMVDFKSVEDILRNMGDLTQDIRLSALLRSPERQVDENYDGNPENPVDLRNLPRLVNEQTSVTLTPTVTCGGRPICEPDITLSHPDGMQSIEYRASSNRTFDRVVVGSQGVTTINISLVVSTRNDPAIGSAIRFNIPPEFELVRVEVISEVLRSCGPGENDTTICLLPRFISSASDLSVFLIWRKSADVVLTGNEPNAMSTVEVLIDQRQTPVLSRDTNPTNNRVTLSIPFGAIADLEFTQLRYDPNSLTYDAMPGPEPITLQNLGQLVQLQASVRNRGPSTLPRAIIEIFIPTQDEDSGGNYYLYPGEVAITGSIGSDNVVCVGANPEKFPPSDGNPSVRRRRSLRNPRQAEMAIEVPPNAINRDCSDPGQNTSCRNVIKCEVTNWQPNQDIMLVINNRLDRRFLMDRSDAFVFVSHGRVTKITDFVEDLEGTNAATSDSFVLKREVIQDDKGIDIWVPIVAVIGALIIIIILFIVLYFVGFFRRKKFEETEGGDFEVREVPPDEDATGTADDKPPVAVDDKPVPPEEPNGAAGLGDVDKEEGRVVDETTAAPPPYIDPAPVPDSDKADLGDTSDLQDGDLSGGADADDDETSI